MTNIANDALNRGWNLGFATGKVRPAGLAGEPLEQEETRAAPATSLAIAAVAIGIFCLVVAFGPSIYFNGG